MSVSFNRYYPSTGKDGRMPLKPAPLSSWPDMFDSPLRAFRSTPLWRCRCHHLGVLGRY